MGDNEKTQEYKENETIRVFLGIQMLSPNHVGFLGTGFQGTSITAVLWIADRKGLEAHGGS